MTVKEVVGVLKDVKKIVLGYGCVAVDFDKNNPLMVDAYGNYVVGSILGSDDGYYEIDIAMEFIKVGG